MIPSVIALAAQAMRERDAGNGADPRAEHARDVHVSTTRQGEELHVFVRFVIPLRTEEARQ